MFEVESQLGDSADIFVTTSKPLTSVNNCSQVCIIFNNVIYHSFQVSFYNYIYCKHLFFCFSLKARSTQLNGAGNTMMWVFMPVWTKSSPYSPNFTMFEHLLLYNFYKSFSSFKSSSSEVEHGIAHDRTNSVAPQSLGLSVDLVFSPGGGRRRINALQEFVQVATATLASQISVVCWGD